MEHEPKYAQVYALVRGIPPGKVASYGQIAAYVPGCTARMVGYAMASLPTDNDVPWHRVINAQGKISPRGDKLSAHLQQELLEAEGVVFSPSRRVDWKTVRWPGPSFAWRIEHGFDPEPSWDEHPDFDQDFLE